MEETDSMLLQEARTVLRQLMAAGFQAYLVGGFVRDYVLGRPIHDIDIATSARPDDVMRIFRRTIPTGIEHGTVTVLSHGHSFEVTTFRVEGGYEDHRRPDFVQFVDSLEEDLSRRDFTMNAMAMNIDGEVIDPFHGQADLKAGVLRCVGEAERRFKEDALRMLRCIRFATNYNLRIDEEAWQSILAQRETLRHIAMERVRVELVKTIEGAHPERGLKLLLQSGLLACTKAPLCLRPYADQNIASDQISELPCHKFERMSDMTAGARWASLFVSGEHTADEADEMLRKLTFSNETRQHIVRIVSMYEELRCIENNGGKNGGKNGGGPAWRDHLVQLAIRYGKKAASGCAELLMYSLDDRWPSELQNQTGDWLEEITIWTPAELAVNGHDMKTLIQSKHKGPWIGKLLQQLTLDVALGEVENTKEPLMARARNYTEKWDVH